MRKKKMIKNVLVFVLSICMVMCTNLTAFASSTTPNDELSDTFAATYKDVPIKLTGVKSPQFAEKEYDTQDVLNYLQTSPKTYSCGISVIEITDSFSARELSILRAGGEVSGSFTSARMDTGTPGVEWDYTVNYTVSSLPTGDGWYFKSVTCNVAVYKTWVFYTWATYGTISFTNATYSLSPRTYPTSITVNISLEFSIVTEATGFSPIVYYENHSATTTINNIVRVS